jgi:transcriptional regulator with XRE-family HTH domain
LTVAERLRISEKRYWRIENGFDTPTSNEVVTLARLFKVETSDLPFHESAVA